MKSVRCIHCGLLNWAEAETCKRCHNRPLAPAQENFGGWADASAPDPAAPGADRAYGANDCGPAQGDAQRHGHATVCGSAPGGGAKRRTGLAVASLVLGILSLVTFSFFLVGGLTALVLGIVALARAHRQPQVYGGSGLAVGGVVTSALSLVLIVPFAIIMAIAIPNLLASQRAANEASAIRGVRELVMAEGTYSATAGDGEFGTMEQLFSSGLVEEALASGLRSGYLFELTLAGANCTINAVPMQYGVSGTRSFHAECDGSAIHYADKRGRPANSSDPVVK